jgi:hypothetical protein
VHGSGAIRVARLWIRARYLKIEMETRGRGVLDSPLEPVIALAEGETRWRGMTVECVVALGAVQSRLLPRQPHPQPSGQFLRELPGDAP